VNQRPRPTGRRRPLSSRLGEPATESRPLPVADTTVPASGAESFEDLERAVEERRRAALARDVARTDLTRGAEPAGPTRGPAVRGGTQAARARRALGSVEDLRRAILLREIIGPPAALRPSPADSLLSDQMGS
jgi:hypothetical protein